MSMVHISLSGDRLICGEASFVTEYYLSECSDEECCTQRELRLKSNLFYPGFVNIFISALISLFGVTKGDTLKPRKLHDFPL